MSENQEIVYGKNVVIESINAKVVNKVILENKKEFKDFLVILKENKIPYRFCDKREMDQIAEKNNHQGIIAYVTPNKYTEIDELFAKNKSVKSPMVIMLDEVTDVNNIGAILRNVDGFNVNGLVFNKRRQAQITPTVVKISTGAINYVDVCRVTNLVNTIKQFKKEGYFVAYLDMDGRSNLEDVDFDMPLLVVIGGEDKGVTDNIKKHCDFGINITMYGHVNSLNVASATSILCYQRSLIFKNEK